MKKPHRRKIKVKGSDTLKAHQTMVTAVRGNKEATRRAHRSTLRKLQVERVMDNMFNPRKSSLLAGVRKRSGQDDYHLGQAGKPGGCAGYGK